MNNRTWLGTGYTWSQIAFGTGGGDPRVRGVVLGHLDSQTYEKEQRLRKLRVVNGSRSHDLISIDVYLPLTGEMVGI